MSAYNAPDTFDYYRRQHGMSCRLYGALWLRGWLKAGDEREEQPMQRLAARLVKSGIDHDDRRTALMRLKGFGHVSYRELFDLLVAHGFEDVLSQPLPSEPKPKPLVPRCPHCGQRMPPELR